MDYEIPPCFYRVSVKAVIFNESNDKFLVGLEKRGIWELPGGGLDWGEDPKNCIKREIFEEMGLEVTEIGDNPRYIYTCQNQTNHKWVLILAYTVKVKNLDLKPTDECLEIKFIDHIDSENITIGSTVRELIKLIKNG